MGLLAPGSRAGPPPGAAAAGPLLPGAVEPTAAAGNTPGLPPSGDVGTVTFRLPGSTVAASAALRPVGDVSAANCWGWMDPLFKPAMYPATYCARTCLVSLFLKYTVASCDVRLSPACKAERAGNVVSRMKRKMIQSLPSQAAMPLQAHLRLSQV